LAIGDSIIVAISPKQVYTTLQLLEQKKMYQEYSDSLFIQKKKLELYILSLQSLNALKTEKTHLLEVSLGECDSINILKEQRIALLNKSVKSEQSKKTRSFLVGGGFGIVISTIIAIITNTHK